MGTPAAKAHRRFDSADDRETEFLISLLSLTYKRRPRDLKWFAAYPRSASADTARRGDKSMDSDPIIIISKIWF
jgi:hypothetical protein